MKRKSKRVRYLLRPGETAPISGQFEIVRRGRRTLEERTVVRGEPLPPSPRRGDRYRIADRSRNRAGRGGDRTRGKRRAKAATRRIPNL